MIPSSRSPLTLPETHVGLYVHVPFCVRKCRYCDFSSQPLHADVAVVDRYLDALTREARVRRAELEHPVHSIFIGGGTPTALTGEQLRRLWDEVLAPLPHVCDVEVTLEANPGTLNDDVLSALSAWPLTRVSLGVQSLLDHELVMLGRIHTATDADSGVRALREIGIPAINLDLIYALPGQTCDAWEATLRRALVLAPEHLSLYSLILEDNTPLSAQVAAGMLPQPGEEEEERMVAMTGTLLDAAGFVMYEVSNAARPGAHCRHNLGYWLGRDYLGLGPAATSKLGTLRWKNMESVSVYAERQCAGLPVTAYAERLSAREHLLERVMLGLRLRDGFDLREAERACGCALSEVAGEELTSLVDDGLLIFTKEGILSLTDTSHRLANMIVARVMAAASR